MPAFNVAVSFTQIFPPPVTLGFSWIDSVTTMLLLCRTSIGIGYSNAIRVRRIDGERLCSFTVRTRVDYSNPVGAVSVVLLPKQ